MLKYGWRGAGCLNKNIDIWFAKLITHSNPNSMMENMINISVSNKYLRIFLIFYAFFATVNVVFLFLHVRYLHVLNSHILICMFLICMFLIDMCAFYICFL